VQKTKIKMLQLDPYGYCNAKCWFCPVKYYAQPEEGSGNMPVELIEKIFSDISKEKKKPDSIVSPTFRDYFTAHYNEVLLYKNFEDLLKLTRKYGFRIALLSNGIGLTKQRTDLIEKYKDVVFHIGLNIPAFEREVWSERAGFHPDLFDNLIKNLKYATEKLTYLGPELRLGMNGLTNQPFNTGFLKKGQEFDKLNIDLDPNTGELARQYNIAKKMFPTLNISKSDHLIDRVGSITNVISNQEHMKQRMKGGKVVGCSNFGDRTTDWLHVNSEGKVFLCCNDYNFEYQYGDLSKQSIREVWLSKDRTNMIEKAFKNICTKCEAAKIEYK
jgi:radical SAM protein with 4Fe4S-binding SPASM domain